MLSCPCCVLQPGALRTPIPFLKKKRKSAVACFSVQRSPDLPGFLIHSKKGGGAVVNDNALALSSLHLFDPIIKTGLLES